MTEFLWSLLYVSMSVSALLLALRLLRAPLLSRYRARTLYLITLGLLLLLLFPSRPSLLPRAAWEAMPMPALQTTIEAAAQAPAPLNNDLNNEMKAPETDAGDPALAGKTATMPVKHIPIRWDLWIGALWLAGSLAALAIRIARHARFLHLLRRWHAPLSPAYREELYTQCARLSVRVPRAARTPLVRTPTVVGLLRPLLLQPEGVTEPEQLPLVLRHELCHLRRGDLWGKAVIELICAAHWFNPLMPLFRRDAALLCELACDEAVLHREDAEGRGAYLTAVVAALCVPDRPATSLSTQFGGGMKRMKQRIALLCDAAPRRRGIGLAAAVLALALCTGGALAAATAPSVTIGPRMPMSGNEEYDSRRMPQEDYDFVMGFQATIRDDLSLDESHALLQPHAARLRDIFYQYEIENWFMEHLQYDLTEMGNLRATRCNYGFSAFRIERNLRNFDRFIDQECSLLWQITDPSKTTVGERNRVVDAIKARLQVHLAEMPWLVGEREKADRLAFQSELEKEFSSEAMDVMLVLRAPIAREWDFPLEGVNEADYERLMAFYQPGYQEQTVAEFNATLSPLQGELQRIYHLGIFAPHGFVRAAHNSLMELEEKAEYWYSDHPYWYTTPVLTYRLRWQVLAPDRLTVADRETALEAATENLRIASLELDYTTLPVSEMTKKIAPRAQDIARELTTDALRIEIADVRFVQTVE